jgi:hypothetical protein
LNSRANRTSPDARETLHLVERKIDFLILGFFWFNLVFITYTFDLEQLLIQDTSDFEYPFWPPALIIDLAHWWGRNFDPLLMARPMWWVMTIWIDALFFGPFYVVGIYAFSKGKEWIRIPAVVYASVMLTNVTIILGEEFFGAYPAPYPFIVVAANAAWIIFPLIIIARMTTEHPFTKAARSKSD